MKNIFLHSAIAFFLLSINVNAQKVKPFKSLTNAEYQQLKDNGKLSKFYPEIFGSQNLKVQNVVNKSLPNNSASSSAKNKTPKYGGNNAKMVGNFQSSQIVNCGTLGYEPPITTPTLDLNGDMVMDTIVPFANGVAPFYRNDDGSSPPFHLPFPFCFYGAVINAPGSANQNFYVNNNGSISFGQSFFNYLPPNFPVAGFTMIGAYFSDVDTRGDSSGVVWMRRMPHYAMFKWDRVGYFASQDDKLNSFMIVITDGTSPLIPDQLNAAIYYDDMEWALGSTQTSSAANASTVGANAGDGTQFFKIGRFDHLGIDYDGPNGINDGVDWLDHKNFYFSACGSTNNLAPVVLGLNICDTLSICIGDTFNYDFTYLGPEFNQNVTITIVPPTNPIGFTSSVNYATPTAPIGHIEYVSNNMGEVTFQVFATDNASPPISSNLITVTLQTTNLVGSASHFNSGCLNPNGSISYNLTTGGPPYSISIDSGQTFLPGNVADNLPGGTYDVVLMDVGGCTLDTIITVDQPLPLSFDSTSVGLGITDVLCYGASNGSAIFAVTGDTNSVIVYDWIMPNAPVAATAASAYGIPANTSTTNPNYPTYWFIATDIVNQCRDSVKFRILEPTVLTAVIDTNYVTCLNSTDTMIAYPNGGTPPYTVHWNVFPQQVNDTAFNIFPGPISADITDANGCQTSAFGVLINGSVLSYELTTKNLSCHGIPDGEATVQLSGGIPPYVLNWYIGNNPPIVAIGASDTRLNLDRSNNFVVLKNQNECDSVIVPFSIFEPDTLRGIITSTNTACLVAQNGAIKVDAIGGTPPYRYNWNTNENTKAIVNLFQGSYNVDILDTNNCIINVVGVVGYDTNIVVVAIPDFVYEINSASSLSVTVERQNDYTGQYTYTWSNGSILNDSTIATPVINQMFFPETFRVDVIDDLGCAGFDSVTVTTVPIIYIPTAFSPNEDGLNETFELGVDSVEMSNFSIKIFDRWGQVQYISNSPRFKWNGKAANGEPLVGMYNYNISYTDNRNKKQFINGVLTVMK